MKCRTCGNEMEIRQTETGKVAICHHCKIKRKLVKKSDRPIPEDSLPQTYSNIPDEDARRKSEKNVKDNYSQMISAGSDVPGRSAKSSAERSRPSGSTKKRRKNRKRRIAKLIIIIIIVAILTIGGFFTFKFIQNKLEGRSSGNQTKTETPNTPENSINVTSDNFSLEYIKHEVSKDRDGNPCLLVYYTFTNKQSFKASALATVSLTAEQNKVPCPNAIMEKETEELSNGILNIENGQAATICQAFVLADQSAVTLTVSDLLKNDAPVLGEQTISLE